jgi:hypothetical protein
MIIPQIDRDLATIKAMQIQLESGYHISKGDYEELLDVMVRLHAMKFRARKQLIKDGVL